MVQFYQHLFAGLKNFEAANYHQVLTAAYFESILFLLVKRVQPYLEKNPEDSEEKTYLLQQIQLIIEIPIKDYVAKYEKHAGGKLVNQRNVRRTIPEKYAAFVNDVLTKLENPQIIDIILKPLLQQDFSIHNCLKLYKAFLKAKFNNAKYTAYVQENICKNTI